MTGFQSKRLMAFDKVKVPLTEEEREEMEDFLVDEDFDYIMQTDSGLEFLRDILAMGHKGYIDYTDAELIAEVKERKAMKEIG